MREPDYRGLAALAIAVAGAIGIFVIVPIAVLLGGKVDAGKDVLVALGGALVGAFAVYMGMRNGRPDNAEQSSDRPKPLEHDPGKPGPGETGRSPRRDP